MNFLNALQIFLHVITMHPIQTIQAILLLGKFIITTGFTLLCIFAYYLWKVFLDWKKRK